MSCLVLIKEARDLITYCQLTVAVKSLERGQFVMLSSQGNHCNRSWQWRTDKGEGVRTTPGKLKVKTGPPHRLYYFVIFFGFQEVFLLVFYASFRSVFL